MTKLPKLALPDVIFPETPNVPVTFEPELEITNTLAVPALLKDMLPLLSTSMLLVPLDNDAVLRVINDSVPNPSVDSNCPLDPPEICTLLIEPNTTLAVLERFTVPLELLTVNPVSSPTLVILGCALVVTVLALETVPVIFAPATLDIP